MCFFKKWCFHLQCVMKSNKILSQYVRNDRYITWWIQAFYRHILRILLRTILNRAQLSIKIKHLTLIFFVNCPGHPMFIFLLRVHGVRPRCMNKTPIVYFKQHPGALRQCMSQLSLSISHVKSHSCWIGQKGLWTTTNVIGPLYFFPVFCTFHT